MADLNEGKKQPLAFRLSPRTLDEYAGQEHIIGKGRMLRRMIEADRLSSIILFGPPGVGKTALARVIANTTESRFERLNAVTAGVADIKKVTEDARNPIISEGRKTVLFIDEIHRFNKLQQDALLPFVEDGTIVLIGATTENPYFEVNGALLSRSAIFELKLLTSDDIKTLIMRAITDKDNGLGGFDAVIDDDALDFLADLSGGDARRALNAIELGVMTTERSEDGKIHAHFQQTVTATGRISCTEPNLQNIPIRQELGRQLRKAFVPETDECMLIGADYSQIELRVLAHMSGDEALIDAFNRGEDIHRATAANVLGIPESEITPAERSRAKAVNFGVIYGMSAFGLSGELDISRKEAEDYINAYFEKHGQVKKFMDDSVAFAKAEGYVTTLLGRKRYIKEINAPNFMVRQIGERLAMNSPIQGSAADIIKIAMIRVYEAIRKAGLRSKLILQIHDELVINTYPEEKETVEKLLVENMESAYKMAVELKADVNEGKNWYELK